LGLLIGAGGLATLASFLALAITQATLGSPLFFALTTVPYVVYGLLVRDLLSDGGGDAFTHSAERAGLPRLLMVALLLAVAFRVPLAFSPVGSDNDMVRYLYDGRLQRLGYNPFTVIPSDPAVAGTHTSLTRLMPSRNAATPYPAAAQLFFRLVVTISEAPRAMKVAMLACDLLTILVLVAWLRSTRRSPWLALVYAWNPLVILEIAHSGHIDALGALWIAVSAWMLSTGRGMRAAVAALVLAALYFPVRSAGVLPLGAIPNVVAAIRFNGPVFKALIPWVTPQGAAAFAVLAGLTVATWMRYRRPADDPAAWAWPMAVSLAAAPVVYPWYLLYFTPFLFTRAAVPLLAWTYTALPVYLVWHLSKDGYRWAVPERVLWFEYGSVLLVLMVLTVLKGANGAGAKGATGAEGAEHYSHH
jgi:alpha-1,6-mannosyltransferase